MVFTVIDNGATTPISGTFSNLADGTIQFNLACYQAQMGSLDRAKAHLKRATEIDAKYRVMALEDRDLAPLWASLATDRA